jgi:site-specific recombinase XerD
MTESASEGSSEASRAVGRPGANKGVRYPAEILTPDEVRALIRGCSATAPTGIRNRALIAVLWRGGLRIAEALALRPADVDVAAGTVTVLHGKGDRRRVVGLDPGAMALVDRWLEERRELGLGRRRSLFCTLGGQVLKSQYVRQLLPRLAARAGIAKRVHPHGLRHTHAVELVGEGVPVNLIQEQLGHASLQTTAVYLRHLAPAERVDRMRRRSWSL